MLFTPVRLSFSQYAVGQMTTLYTMQKKKIACGICQVLIVNTALLSSANNLCSHEIALVGSVYGHKMQLMLDSSTNLFYAQRWKSTVSLKSLVSLKQAFVWFLKAPNKWAKPQSLDKSLTAERRSMERVILSQETDSRYNLFPFQRSLLF